MSIDNVARALALSSKPKDTWAAARGISGVTQALRSWIKAASIDNLILPVGVWAGATGPSVGANSVMDQEAAIEAAVAAFNDPLCRYIPVSKPNAKYGPIIYGTGKVGSTNGSGNSDTLTTSDGVHPPQAGHTEIAKQLAIRVQDALSV